MTTLEATHFVSKVFCSLAQEIVKRHFGDLLLDVPEAVEQLADNKPVLVLSRATGSDLSSRFVRALKCLHGENYQPRGGEAFQECNRTLGFSVATWLYPNGKVEVWMNDTCEYDIRHGGRRINERGDLVREWRDYLLRTSEEMETEIILTRSDYLGYVESLRRWKLNVADLSKRY